MRQNYKIDPARIYLLGYSMGAIGTWSLGAKHPDVWAALAPVSGLGDVTSVGRMKQIPEIVVHGDADTTINVENSRTMVAELKRQGVDFRYIEVPGGTHNNVLEPNLKAIFDFFDAHRK
jgi:predicted peptidase